MGSTCELCNGKEVVYCVKPFSNPIERIGYPCPCYERRIHNAAVRACLAVAEELIPSQQSVLASVRIKNLLKPEPRKDEACPQK
jgi:hypothetical protein